MASTLLASLPAGNALWVVPPSSVNLPFQINTLTQLAPQPPFAGITVYPGPFNVGTTASQVPSTSGNYIDFYYLGPNPPPSTFIVGANFSQTMFGTLGTITGLGGGPGFTTASESVHFPAPPSLSSFDVTFNLQYVALQSGLSIFGPDIGNGAPQSGSAFSMFCIVNDPSHTPVDQSQPIVRMLFTSITTPINVPEPSTLALAALGFAALALWRLRRR
jgi:hypothetical protein